MTEPYRNILRVWGRNSAVKSNFWPKLIIETWWNYLVILTKETNVSLLQSLCQMVLFENIWMVRLCNVLCQYLYSNMESNTDYRFDIAARFVRKNPGFQSAAWNRNWCCSWIDLFASVCRSVSLHSLLCKVCSHSTFSLYKTKYKMQTAS